MNRRKQKNTNRTNRRKHGSWTAATVRPAVTPASLRPARTFLLPIGALLLACLFAPHARASMGVAGYVGSTSGDTHFQEVTGLAVNASGAGGVSAGDIYVSDRGNSRITQIHADGSFVRGWGTDVVKGGQDQSNATFALTVDATGGNFTLAAYANSGTGELEFERSTVTNFEAIRGSFEIGQEITAPSGIPAGTTITDISENGKVLTLSNKATRGLRPAGLSTSPQPTAEIPASASAAQVEGVLNSLPAISAGGGSVHVTGGPGGVAPYIITFDGGPLAGLPAAMAAASGPGSPLSGAAATATVALMNVGETGFEICEASPPSNDTCKKGTTSSYEEFAIRSGGFDGLSGISVNQTTGDVYISAQPTGRVNQYTASGQFLRAFGQDVVASGPGNVTPHSAVQTLTVTASGGAMDLTFGAETAAAVPYDVTAADLQTALRGLSSIGGSNVEVANPSPGTYTITFAGDLADNPEPTIAVSPNAGNPLTGGGASLATTTSGASGLEVCEPVNGDVCKAAQNAASGGALGLSVGGLTVAPPGAPNAGNVLVAEPGHHRVEEFSAEGAFVRAFGFDVVKAGPGDTGTGFEVCEAAAGDACKSSSEGSGVGQLSQYVPEVTEDTSGAIYVADRGNFRVQKFTPEASPPGLAPSVFGTAGAPTGTGYGYAPRNIAVGPSGRVFVGKDYEAGATPSCPEGSPSIEEESRIQELSADGLTLLDTHLVCNGITDEHFSSGVSAIAVNPSTGQLLAAGETPPSLGGGPDLVYFVGVNGPPSAVIDAVEPTTSGAKISATIEPNGPAGSPPNAVVPEFQAEYKRSDSSTWSPSAATTGHSAGGFSPVHVSLQLGGLEPNTSYDFRLVVSKAFGQGRMTTPAQSFVTLLQAPSIDSFFASGVTAHSADLNARINPHGTDTTYHFEYGTTSEYGQRTPDVEIGHALESQTVQSHVEALDSVTYHFRVVAENAIGTTVSGDQTFEFYPPDCPNSAARQQTGANYLPDCRAYELVSPADANGTLFYSGGPTSPYATSPARFAYTGAYSTLPGVTNNIGTVGDLYVATRGPTGWTSHYVGPPGDQTGCAGGPPNHPWSYATHAEKLQSPVLVDQGMDRILDFDLGSGYRCYFAGNGVSDGSNEIAVPSNAPFLWSAEGKLVTRLPTNLESVPGAAAALACPTESTSQVYPQCTSDVSASGDLTHLVFSSSTLDFAPGGLTVAPGSAYDNDLATGTVSLISTLPGGAPIPRDVSGPAEFIRFPGVSTDGSHILMSTATQSTPFCTDKAFQQDVTCPRFTDSPIHLYMSIDDQPAIEVSKSEVSEENVGVHFLAMSPDGTRVYFTSSRQLKSEDEDTSTDIYMWTQKGEEEGEPLTLISKAAPGSPPGVGNSDACSPATVEKYNDVGEPVTDGPWTTKCSAVPFSGWSYATAEGGVGGNGTSDSGIAAGGDFYFYSPEQLEGLEGLPGLHNLYLYHHGEVRYVTTPDSEKSCVASPVGGQSCASGPIARLQVAADGSRMAFVTGARLSAYDNAGRLEMYVYERSNGSIVCASCRPDGQPPTGDVQASQNGLFLTEDGRTFFSTTDALVPRDTNEGVDVYEYVDGRPQLITPGTGTAKSTVPKGIDPEIPGLIGVSANGGDVYFSTFDTLISEDQNGSFLKFYDARTGGGFRRLPPGQPCAAAEECHGPGTEAPALPAQGTAAALAGGNVKSKPHKRTGKRSKQRRKRKQHERKEKESRRQKAAHKRIHRHPSHQRNSDRRGLK